MRITFLVGAIGLAIFALAGYNLIQKPYQEQLRLLKADYDQEHETQQQRATVAELLDELERYRKRLPPGPDPSWLVRETMALSRQAGVTLSNIAQRPPERLGTLTRLTAQADFVASYHGVGTFLDQIEQSKSFIKIQQLSVTPSRGDAEGEHSIRVIVSSFYLPAVVTEAEGG